MYSISLMVGVFLGPCLATILLQTFSQKMSERIIGVLFVFVPFVLLFLNSFLPQNCVKEEQCAQQFKEKLHFKNFICILISLFGVHFCFSSFAQLIVPIMEFDFELTEAQSNLIFSFAELGGLLSIIILFCFPISKLKNIFLSAQLNCFFYSLCFVFLILFHNNFHCFVIFYWATEIFCSIGFTALYSLGTYVCRNASLYSGWLTSASVLGNTLAPLADFMRVFGGTTHLMGLYLSLTCICTACAFSLEYSETKNEYRGY